MDKNGIKQSKKRIHVYNPSPYNRVLDKLEVIVEHTKIWHWIIALKANQQLSPDKHTSCQDINRSNKYDKAYSQHMRFACIRSKVVEVARDWREISLMCHPPSHLVDATKNQILDERRSK